MNRAAIQNFLLHRKRALGREAGTLLLLVLAFGLTALGPSSAQLRAAAVAYPRELSRIRFAVAGDVIPHQPVVQSAAAQKITAPTQPAEVSPSATPPVPIISSPPTASAASQSPALLSPEKQMPASAPASTPAGNNGGWDALFASVADAFHQADFGFVNLETPVAPKHSRGSRPFQFDAPVDLLRALKFSGVKIVSFANNHVFDQGYAGFGETLEHLREEGLPFAGAGDSAEDAWKPVILEKNGIKVGWLGMTRWLNGGRNPEKETLPHVAFFPYPGEAPGAPGISEEKLLEAIKAARAQCDFLLISIHWGTEYAVAPRDADVEIAHKMLEAGAGAIIGHHPHVLQPIETYITQDKRTAVIFYSLGNFVSNQSSRYVQGLTPEKSGEQRDSLLARFSIIRKDYGPGGIRVELGDLGIMPVWTENNRLQAAAKHAKTLVIRPVFIDREIARLQARFDELTKLAAMASPAAAPEAPSAASSVASTPAAPTATPPANALTPEQKQELVEVSSQLQLLQRRRELLLARTGDDYLVPPPTP